MAGGHGRDARVLGGLRVPLRGTRTPCWAIQNPRARRSIETRGLASDERHTPAAQILIERVGVAEHAEHVRDAADVPRTDVLIDCRGASEHFGLFRVAADVP